MAKGNKYASINFNHIYHKNLSPTKQPSQSSSSYSSLSSPNNSYKAHTRSNGRMLVLSRPAPSPPPPQPQTQPQPQPHPVRSGSDSISLRPLGTSGSDSVVLNMDKNKEVFDSAVMCPKTNRFVPPHLRPGFVGKEERPGPEAFRSREAAHRNLPQQGILGSPGRHGEDGRPSSGGYERYKDGNLGYGNRPRSSGNRPNSSG